jgi:hypothetical protein
MERDAKLGKRPDLTRSKFVLRASGVRGLLIYCADYRCSRSIAISDDDQMRKRLFGNR